MTSPRTFFLLIKKILPGLGLGGCLALRIKWPYEMDSSADDRELEVIQPTFREIDRLQVIIPCVPRG
jgi:hypothetical protein